MCKIMTNNSLLYKSLIYTVLGLVKATHQWRSTELTAALPPPDSRRRRQMDSQLQYPEKKRNTSVGNMLTKIYNPSTHKNNSKSNYKKSSCSSVAKITPLPPEKNFLLF